MPAQFEQEQCRCGRDGELVESANGGYRWRCRNCGVSWVRCGSPMDVANELINCFDCEEDE